MTSLSTLTATVKLILFLPLKACPLLLLWFWQAPVKLLPEPHEIFSLSLLSIKKEIVCSSLSMLWICGQVPVFGDVGNCLRNVGKVLSACCQWLVHMEKAVIHGPIGNCPHIHSISFAPLTFRWRQKTRPATLYGDAGTQRSLTGACQKGMVTMEVIATASDAIGSQLDSIYMVECCQLLALGVLIGCMFAFAVYKGWLL